jgi:hypothetical protein
VRFRWADMQEFVAKLETEKNFKHR